MANFIEAIFHLEKRELKKLERVAEQVMALDSTMAALTDDELRAKTDEFKAILAKAETPEEKDQQILGRFPKEKEEKRSSEPSFL